MGPYTDEVHLDADSSAQSSRSPAAEGRIGVVGGSGLYTLLSEGQDIDVETPFGSPSDVATVGKVGDREVVFIPRHGGEHQWPPHRINYRANLWALASLGVVQILAPCAVGSLSASNPAGTIVVPDQIVDRTFGREHTFVTAGVNHVSFADPYCPVGRATVMKAAADVPNLSAVDGGTMVVIEGPRFSTRAESRSYARAGFSVINMTGMPEASLARELALCYTSIALVTDLDAGVDSDAAVTQSEALRVFAANTKVMRDLLFRSIEALPRRPVCDCPNSLEGLNLDALSSRDSSPPS